MSCLNDTVKKIVEILDKKMARDIVILNVGPLTTITDYFVIATGSSTPQVQALSDNLEEELLKIGVKPKSREGYGTADWILLSFDDVIVHIFKGETREFYNLEHIWKDAESIDVSDIIKE